MADKWIQLMSEDGTDNLFPTSKMDLLWENASPTSAFSAQTLNNINTSGYKWILFDIKTHLTSSLYVYFLAKPIDYIRPYFVTDSTTANNNLTYRNIELNGSQVIISSPVRGSGNVVSENNAVVPIKIFGIK